MRAATAIARGRVRAVGLWEQRCERKLASVLQRRQPIVFGGLPGRSRHILIIVNINNS